MQITNKDINFFSNVVGVSASLVAAVPALVVSTLITIGGTSPTASINFKGMTFSGRDVAMIASYGSVLLTVGTGLIAKKIAEISLNYYFQKTNADNNELSSTLKV